MKRLWDRLLLWLDGVMDPFIEDGYGTGGRERLSEAVNRSHEPTNARGDYHCGERPENLTMQTEGSRRQ